MIVIDKIKFLTTIEKLEIVDIQQLANYLGVKYKTTATRLERYQQRGRVEFYAVGNRRRCLSPVGAKYLGYLRKRQEEAKLQE